MSILTGFSGRARFLVGAFFILGTEAALRAEQVLAGASVALTVTADGTPPFSYQWQKDGTNIPGATAVRHSIGSMSDSDAGKYTVIVSNSAGSVMSTTATLTVLTPEPKADAMVPVERRITTGESLTSAEIPVSQAPVLPAPAGDGLLTQVAIVGHSVTLGSEGSNGQWQVSSDAGASWRNLSNGGAYSGVNSNELSVADVTTGFSGYRYRFAASGSGGSIIVLSISAALFPFPVGIAADGYGNLYVGDSSSDTVQMISSSGIVSLFAGLAGQTGTADGVGSNARFNDPSGLIVSADGTISLCDSANGTIRRIGAGAVVSTLAGSRTNRGNVDGIGSLATFSSPLGIGQDAGGNLYVADALNHTIRKITSLGAVSTVAGSPGLGGSADGIGNTARFNHPTGVAVDNAGNIYVADAMNNTVRKISPTGSVATLAGLPGVSGFQDGFGGGALFNNPCGIAVDSLQNVYVADTGNSIIRRISPSGVVSTLAGLPGIAGLKDGLGDNAWFNQPQALTLDSSEVLYVTDTGNAAIRRISSDGRVETLSLSAAEVAAPVPTPSPGKAAENAGTGNVSVSSSAAAGSGGGGGGSLEDWFVSALGLALLLRGCFAKRRFAR